MHILITKWSQEQNIEDNNMNSDISQSVVEISMNFIARLTFTVHCEPQETMSDSKLF